MTHFLVLGAGPAGIGAALWLARSGREVTVVERSPLPGGLAASFDVAGMRVDQGSHRLHRATSPEILAELRALLGNDLQTRTRNGRIRMAGRFVGFPPRPLDLVRCLPPSLAGGFALDAVGAPFRRPHDDSFSEAVRSSLGPTLLRTFYEPYVRKIWGVPGSQLDADLAVRRVGARSGSHLVRRALARSSGTRTFFYPRRGFGQITDALAAAATDAGARILTGEEVVRVSTDERGARVDLASGRLLDGAQVWSTLPINALSALAGGPEVPLHHRALVLVYIVVGQARWTPFDAHYLPEPSMIASRISEPRNYRDSSDDPADRTVLCCEVPCSVGDDVWNAAPEDLAPRICGAFAAEDLPDIAPIHVECWRVPRAYPVYEPGFAARLERAEQWVAAQPNLLTFGRQGLFAHDNTHHALAMARAAVDALDGDDRLDVRAWAAARERFREHVVQD